MLKTGNVVAIDRDKAAAPPRSNVRVISVTSGKGGVGKSNVVVNLALAFRKLGQRVLILDGDFGLANIDILLNIPTAGTLSDVLHKGRPIRDIVARGPLGIDVIPSSSGVLAMSQLSNDDKNRLIALMEEFDWEYDVVLIDTAAGIHSDVMWLNATASEVIVVTTPEPTAITDAYAMIKVLYQSYRVKRVKLLVNQVKNSAEGLKVYNKLSDVSDRFLNIGIDYAGAVRWDGCVAEAVKKRQPLLTSFPSSASAENFTQVAKSMFESSRKARATGGAQFFWHSLVGNV